MTASIAAQQKGRVVGTVKDATTGEGLPGVNVILKGTYYGAATGLDGVYHVDNINPGEYTLQFSLIGYTTLQQTGVEIRVGETRTIDANLKETVLAVGTEVVVIGDRPLFDIEQASSAKTIQSDEIRAAPVISVQEIASRQIGVTQTGEGIYIRGARSYETAYYVDGVSAKDPLAGTGFGLDVGAKALKEVEVITGGIGAEYGGTAGVISVTTQEGGDRLSIFGSYKRDGLWFNDRTSSHWNTDVAEVNIGGPIFQDEMTYFASFTGYFSDEYTRAPARQLHSSILDGGMFMPRQDNRWNGLLKISYKPVAMQRWQASYRRSLNVNQNTRMLQIGGNDVQLRPGYQYEFALQPDNANTYTHDSQLWIVRLTQTLSSNLFFDAQVSRLFTKLRADANGRPWRPDSISEDLDAASIITDPISYWQYSDFARGIIYVIQGNPYLAGLYNNGGIAPLWHDHFVDEYTFKLDFTFHASQEHKIRGGIESKFQEFQWIDINLPWVGAPLKPGDPPRSLGRSFDIWHVWPAQGSFFFQDQITFKGMVAYLGTRFQYWFPGKFIDDLMRNPSAVRSAENPQGIVAQRFKEAYDKDSFTWGNRTWKGRFLPRLRVSFPVSDNQVLFFNYGHAVDWPNAYQVYSGLDLQRQDRSFLARVGNPSLNPETTVEYEIGLRNQFTNDDVFTLSAYNKDKFDYVVRRYIPEIDKTTYVNEDYARINGIELSYTKRVGSSFMGTISGSYQVAKGKSNSAEASFFRFSDEETTKEKFLAWDRPFQLRASGTIRADEPSGVWNIPWLNKFSMYFQLNYQSGKRFTPYITTGVDANTQRVIYREDLSAEYQKIGQAWFWTDLTFQKWIDVEGTKLTLFIDVTNLFNNKNSNIINPLTGRAYELGDLTPFRDPTDPHPSDRGIPPFDPARYLEQRHIVGGISITL
ncbi:MAG: TonB-dependent receptor [Ignavibacteriales bacterium]|nr:TonB-dependent receptor [Ignavibacteriales bacterium]